MANKLGVGIIGCGNISEIYLTNLSKRFDSVKLIACADMLADRSKAKAEKHGIEALSVAEMLARKDIDIIVNLTIPLVHAEVSLQAIAAGKHVYTEKPLSAWRADGKKVMEAAAKKGVYVGGAPDTFLGAGIQTCKDIIASGAIGIPHGGTANMLCPGHEGWHPDPAFYYKKGGGPVLDMGPYYITALVELLGPAAGVMAYQQGAFKERTVGSGPKKGEKITVDIPTHTAGLIRFANGAVVTLSMSFDVIGSQSPRIEVWGTEASLVCPDPNTFGGPVLIRKRGEKEWTDVPVTKNWADNSRGLGVAEMASAIMEKRKARASGALCFHVLDVMEGLGDAAAKKAELDVSQSGKALAAK